MRKLLPALIIVFLLIALSPIAKADPEIVRDTRPEIISPTGESEILDLDYRIRQFVKEVYSFSLLKKRFSLGFSLRPDLSAELPVEENETIGVQDLGIWGMPSQYLGGLGTVLDDAWLEINNTPKVFVLIVDF